MNAYLFQAVDSRISSDVTPSI